MLEVMESTDFFKAGAEALHKAGGRPAWAARLQSDGLKRFSDLGWPTSRTEAWRFTPMKGVVRAAYGPAPEHDGTGLSERLLAADSLVLAFVNGRFRADLSRLDGLPEGVTLRPLHAALAADDPALRPHLGTVACLDDAPLTALNTALFAEGVVLHLADGVALEPLVEIVHFFGGDSTFAVQPRVLVSAGAGASCALVETFTGPAPRVFANSVTELALGSEAKVVHYLGNTLLETAHHVHHTAAVLGNGARLESHQLLTGGALVRNSAEVTFDGEGADAYLGGLFVGHDRQVHDNHIRVVHAKGHNTSNQFYKGILDDAARGVFTSRVVVRPDAQKTDSRQSNRNLLLSDKAKVDTQPQLEIYADDVKCAHGATTGQLDDDALFYMQARCLSPERARVLLLYAFAHEIIDRMPHEAVRKAAETFLMARFAAAGILGADL